MGNNPQSLFSLNLDSLKIPPSIALGMPHQLVSQQCGFFVFEVYSVAQGSTQCTKAVIFFDVLGLARSVSHSPKGALSGFPTSILSFDYATS